MDRHVDHPLEIADKRDGRAGDRITFLDRLALLVYCFEHFIDVLKRHVVSQDVIRDRVDLFAIARPPWKPAKETRFVPSTNAPSL